MWLPSKQDIQAEYAAVRDEIQRTYAKHCQEHPQLAARQYCADVVAAMRCRDAQLQRMRKRSRNSS